MKSFAILWAVIFALVMLYFVGDWSQLAARDIFLETTIILAVITFLLSVPIFLLWMVIRYLASKLSG